MAPVRRSHEAVFSTGVVVRRDRRWLALLPVVAALMTVTLWVGREVLGGPNLLIDAADTGHASAYLVGLGTVLTGLLLMWQRVRQPAPQGGRLTFRDDIVRVDHGVGIPLRQHRLAAKRQGYVRPQGEGYEVCLVLEDGRVLGIAAGSREEAESLLAQAEIDPSRHALQVSLCEAGPWNVLLRLRRRLHPGPYLYAPALFAAIMAVHLLQPVDALRVLAATYLGAFLMLVDTLVGLADAPRVRVGGEGVLVEGLFHRRFIPVDAISRADALAGGVVLSLSDGSRVILPIATGRDASFENDPAAQDARRDLLMDLLREAVERPAEVDVPAMPLLAQQGRDLETWSVAARSLLGRDYRSASHAADTLVSVVGASRAPRDQRIGAALALAHHPDPAIRGKLRIAIDTCADPALEAAIEAAAAAELDAEHLESALAAAE